VEQPRGAARSGWGGGIRLEDDEPLAPGSERGMIAAPFERLEPDRFLVEGCDAVEVRHPQAHRPDPGPWMYRRVGSGQILSGHGLYS
jgi:hypothetical protein